MSKLLALKAPVARNRRSQSIIASSLKLGFTFFLGIFLVSLSQLEVQAQPINNMKGSASEFITPPGLRPAVDFWLLLFTKYGKHQVVFHHRLYPSIVYSVLDFREMSETLLPGEYERRRKSEVSSEVARISGTLEGLASGKKATTPFESRIERMFQSAGLSSLRSAYSDAATEDNVRSQTGIKERFKEGLIRSRRYLYAIEQIFRELNLPKELARVPFIESSFDYTAYSSVGAAGIWQFMRGTAQRYMRVDPYIDERRDPIIASRAAAQYLSHAYDVLGAWPLAVTSYNHGVNGVLRASRAVGTKDLATIIKRYDGPSFGFASKSFFPSFLAALEADRGVKQYFPELNFESPMYFDEVRLGSSTSFRQLSQISGAGEERLTELNRAFLKPVLTGRVAIPAGTVVKVPPGAGARVASGIRGSGEVHLTHIPPKRAIVPIKPQRTPKTSSKSAGNSSKKVSKKSDLPAAKTSNSKAKKSNALPKAKAPNSKKK